MLEKTSISTADMLDTVAAEVEVKKRSMSSGMSEVVNEVVFDAFKAMKPSEESVMK